ncbi:dihydroorotate dehydrogenase [Rhizoctonia solani AG-1 IB]|uniref:Dihydroorotate dehydrogenase (quinone), mitochondrial n=1 Tax=Thanatephorus cucumeris (strain AG1-IB / isolate 7/3/14) TaxID=1108050 RepID=A0A0B7G1N9_THACB|nr:dihydroorotate dehydrogenase [Rhizoctonia solani AG-1 IB]
MQSGNLRAGVFRINSRITVRRLPQSTRFASSSTEAPVIVAKPVNSGLGTALKASALVLGTGLFIAYYYDSRSAIHRWVVPPLMRATLDPEVAHRMALRVLGTRLAPTDHGVDDKVLNCKLWDIEMPSPVGLAAGFDKDGEAIDGLFGLGFDWVEIGSVTPKPQIGNPKPRVFTLPEDDAMINRYGFPSRGHDLMLARLRSRLRDSTDAEIAPASGPRQVLAVNLGKNKSSPPDSIADYLAGVRRFGAQPNVSVLVINVSSPNTPGLRGLQNRGMLEELLDGVCKERDALPRSPLPKIVLKIAPDLDELAIQDVAEAVRESGVDGVIVSNTTIQRPKLQSASAQEIGGLSGPPLLPLSLKALKALRAHLPSDIPIIGCGGISSGADALEFARAGASSIQLYTAFGYTGVGTARRIKDELSDELQRLGTTWEKVADEAIKSHSWVKPEGQRGLDEGEQELKDMLDVLGKQLTVADDSDPARLEFKDSTRPKELQLDNETRRIVQLAEAALNSKPRGHDKSVQHLPHAQQPSHGIEDSEQSNQPRLDKGALERRRP